MTLEWKKWGMLFQPDGTRAWMRSHAQVPYSVAFDDYIRIYFSTREEASADLQFRSYIGYVDVDKKNLNKILKVAKSPALELGQRGEFDEFGTMAGSVLRHGNKFYLYYCGWQRALSTPYNWAIGLATSVDGKNFKKIGKGPVVGANLKEPYLQACPIVYKIDEDNWVMFYLSGTGWISTPDGRSESKYVLMRATSTDGITWVRDGVPIFDDEVENECQTSCSIIKVGQKFHMFFSYRHGTGFRERSESSYRLGYATSLDMLSWERHDNLVNFTVSPSGWDSEMVAYPHVTRIGDRIIMFYCGNGFGKDGFGYAELTRI